MNPLSTTIIIFAMTVLAMIAVILWKPSANLALPPFGHHKAHKSVQLSLYWIVCLAGAILLLCSGVLNLRDAVDGITADTAVNPIKILLLFLSMTFLSVFLDEAGFFTYLASLALSKATSLEPTAVKNPTFTKRIGFAGQKKLFFTLYVVVSILTVFTSNDIIILTFTPFLCCFAKEAKIDPLPYLIAEFAAANTWSMALIIGNPTNIYLASSSGIEFLPYLKVMWLPALVTGICVYVLLRVLFAKSLSKPLSVGAHIEPIKNKALTAIGLVHLVLCTVLLVISSYIGLEMYVITLSLAGSLILFVLGYSLLRKRTPQELIASMKRLPYELIPFVLSMFVFVLALDRCGATNFVQQILSRGDSMAMYSITSTIAANLINNIPMSVLYVSLSQGGGEAAVYASIIGSNVGALLTPVGALAGIMWSGLLRRNGISFSFLKFVRYCAPVCLVALVASLVALKLTL